MKKILLLLTSFSLIFGACERHPVSQIPKSEGGEAEKSDQTVEATPKAAPSGTPKTYFPK
jgi:hypothetical protein